MSDQTSVDLSKYIETRFFGERPHVRGRRLPIGTIAHNQQTHAWSVARLAYEFTLTEAEVLAALLYYAEHQAVIDAQEAAYQAELEAAQRRFLHRQPY